LITTTSVVREVSSRATLRPRTSRIPVVSKYRSLTVM
jgi:hypothetical protein